jgi:hypothetical protein
MTWEITQRKSQSAKPATGLADVGNAEARVNSHTRDGANPATNPVPSAEARAFALSVRARVNGKTGGRENGKETGIQGHDYS